MTSPSLLRLADFHISDRTGFLLEDPLERLPERFEPWNVLAKAMPDMVEKRTFQKAVSEMAVLDASELQGEKQKRLAHLQLTVIASGYVWQDGQDQAPQMLPACVAVPLHRVSEDLGIKPVISHPGLFLANWQLKDPTKSASLSNFRCLYNLPGGEDTEWFIVITNFIEMEFTAGIHSIVRGAYSMDTKDCDSLASALVGLRESVMAMKNVFSNIHAHVRPSAFYDDIRPFLGGWSKVGSALSGGLLFEGVSDVPLKYIGDTGAQSSIFASIDAFLDIAHSDPESQTFLLSMKGFMPRGHRHFIDVLEARPSTRKFVIQSGDRKLQKAYNDCLAAVADFRSFHIQVVTKYIVVMAKKATSDSKSQEDKGTGGTSVIPFLQGLRAETKGSDVSRESQQLL